MAKRRAAQVLGFIAANVRRERLRLDETQESFAERAKFVTRFYQRIEAGEVDLSISTLVRLSDALGVEPSVLLQPAPAASRPPGRPRNTSTPRKRSK